MERLEQQLAFLLTLDRLKGVERRNYTLAGRRENSAEHSWHVAVAAMLLAEHARSEVNLLRVLELLLVHDVVEIEAGDTYVYDEEAKKLQEAREGDAARRMFSLLPPDQGAYLLQLFEEFTRGRTPEARFARSLDRLLPVLLNTATAGRSWREHGIRAAQVLARNAEVAEGSPALWEAVQKLVAQAQREGFLAP
ncbi:MAG: HD domain-containing protein [Thermoanaerobaculum sp.]